LRGRQESGLRSKRDAFSACLMLYASSRTTRMPKYFLATIYFSIADRRQDNGC
jgi:hypothetical protein